MVENKYYERKIKYLDLMENGERTGGAGFIKTEVRGMDIDLAITVKGLHPTDTYEREVMLLAGDGEFAVGRIALKEGQGQFKYHTVMDYSQLQGIRIVLGGTREIWCKWQEEKKVSVTENNGAQNNMEEKSTVPDNMAVPKEEEQQRSRKSQEIQLIPWDEIKTVEESLERTEKMMSEPADKEVWKAAEKTVKTAAAEEIREGRTIERGTGARGTAKRGMAAKEMTTREDVRRGTAGTIMAGESPGKTKRSMEKTVRTGQRSSGTENASVSRSMERRVEKSTQRPAPASSWGREKKPVRLMEDKWQQIWAIYPHIHPFQDEREYLSISPADFVLLPDEAYRAANNSFLLHGYYNYDHLILTKTERRGEVAYYIGVPGNYYEREKQVAIMFGFESFECGTEPAQVGDFGYYMMKTQL